MMKATISTAPTNSAAARSRGCSQITVPCRNEAAHEDGAQARDDSRMAKSTENFARHSFALPATRDKHQHRKDAANDGRGDRASKTQGSREGLASGQEETSRDEEDQHAAG